MQTGQLRVSRDVQIEQAIAYGRSPQWMREHLGADDQDVADAVTRMNEAADYTDSDVRGRPDLVAL